MLKVLLSGCCGKMGQVISKCAHTNNVNIVAGYDVIDNNKCSFPVYKNIFECHEKIDAIIDFSHPDALENVLNYAVKNNIPVVVATTGLDNNQINLIKEKSKQVPIFFSANMSLGVNLLCELVKKAAAILNDSYDIEIIEKHHNQKIDSPSGTAYLIADEINSILENRMEYIYERESKREKRGKNQIGIHSVRGGTIVGEHTVIFAGTDEIIEIKHTAMSKDIFAIGALKAAKFIFNKKPGLYSMKDMIEEK